MIEIGRTLHFSFQMTCIGSKIRDVILIPVILADFVINLGEFCGLEPQKLDYLYFSCRYPGLQFTSSPSFRNPER